MTVIVSPLEQQTTLSINAQTFGGSLPFGVSTSLMELKYSFPAFNQSDLSNYTKGDLIVFNTDNTSDKNIYSATVEKASTGTELHATKSMMVFIEYSNDTLIAMHKGYLDFDDYTGPLSSWEVGRTIYANGNSISINPSSESGSWVKSIGFCMANSENKKRIWFEPDSTYLILQ
jgi:hypothetical protein